MFRLLSIFICLIGLHTIGLESSFSASPFPFDQPDKKGCDENSGPNGVVGRRGEAHPNLHSIACSFQTVDSPAEMTLICIRPDADQAVAFSEDGPLFVDFKPQVQPSLLLAKRAAKKGCKKKQNTVAKRAAIHEVQHFLQKNASDPSLEEFMHSLEDYLSDDGDFSELFNRDLEID